MILYFREKKNQRLNILLLSQFFSTTKGGGEYVFKIMSDNLSKRGHKVWVITNDVKNENYEITENVKIIKVKPTIEYRGGIPPTFQENFLYVINAFRKAISIIKKEKIDVVHSNNFSPALVGSLISYFTKIPHVTTIHDIFSIYDKKFWKKWAEQTNVSSINARIIPFFEKKMLKLNFDCIHTVSEATKKDILSIGTDKPIRVIPNSISTKSETKQVKKNQFLYLGRLVFYKNIEIILRAFKIVLKKSPNSFLIIAGDGPHKESLKKIVSELNIQKNVEFKGFVSTTEKINLLAESNALLFPSICEGFGLVILEAFSQNRPVLVSNIAPMSDIVSHGETGFVLNPNDEDEWAEHIMKLIDNNQKSDIMGKNGNLILKTKYNQNIMFDKLIEMYNDLVKGKS